MLQYSLAHLSGLRAQPIEDLQQFRQVGTRARQAPRARRHTPSVEITTGPLGQGVANAVGMAIAERFLADTFNRPGISVVDHRTYAICSDGDLMEGVEARKPRRSPAIFGLGQADLTSYDDNDISARRARRHRASSPRIVAKRFRGLRLARQRVHDANDLGALSAAIDVALSKEHDRPSLYPGPSRIIGYPCPRRGRWARRRPTAAALGEDEVRATKEAMGWDPDAHFLAIRRGLRALFRGGDRGAGGARRSGTARVGGRVAGRVAGPAPSGTGRGAAKLEDGRRRGAGRPFDRLERKDKPRVTRVCRPEMSMARVRLRSYRRWVGGAADLSRVDEDRVPGAVTTSATRGPRPGATCSSACASTAGPGRSTAWPPTAESCALTDRPSCSSPTTCAGRSG